MLSCFQEQVHGWPLKKILTGEYHGPEQEEKNVQVPGISDAQPPASPREEREKKSAPCSSEPGAGGLPKVSGRAVPGGQCQPLRPLPPAALWLGPHLP